MRLRRTSGLTIIEVQVALLILLVGILTAVGLAPMGMKGRDVAEKNTHAMAYARHFMEWARAMPYKDQKSMSMSADKSRPLDAVPSPVRDAGLFKDKDGNPLPADQLPPPFFWYKMVVSQIPAALTAGKHEECDGHDLHRISVYIYYVAPDTGVYNYDNLDQPLAAARNWPASDWSKLELYRLVSESAQY
jgi:type II secretory pathway pseudopilin PulG